MGQDRLGVAPVLNRPRIPDTRAREDPGRPARSACARRQATRNARGAKGPRQAVRARARTPREAQPRTTPSATAERSAAARDSGLRSADPGFRLLPDNPYFTLRCCDGDDVGGERARTETGSHLSSATGLSAAGSDPPPPRLGPKRDADLAVLVERLPLHVAVVALERRARATRLPGAGRRSFGPRWPTSALTRATWWPGGS